MSFEKVIFSNLIFREDYARKVIPFLKGDYFTDAADKLLFNLVDSYVQKYNAFPSVEALTIDLNNKDNVDQRVFDETKTSIQNLKFDENTETEWLVDSTEKWCQEKAVYNAIMKSIQILDDSDRQAKGSIPQILSDALAVSFDTHIGHNFIEDSTVRFDFYHRKEEKIEFNLEYFNKITGGGLPKKTLNIALAGCVHPDTKVKIRYRKI